MIQVNTKEIMEKFNNERGSLPPEYFAMQIPELCGEIERLNRVAQESEQMYKPIKTELGGGIHFGYVSDSKVEEMFPQMLRLLLQKARKDGDRQGCERMSKYFEEYKVQPLQEMVEQMKITLAIISEGKNNCGEFDKDAMMGLARITLRDIEETTEKHKEKFRSTYRTGRS